MEFWSSFVDLSVILLALAVGFIPLIGGGLNQLGQMDDLVKNLRIGKKALVDEWSTKKNSRLKFCSHL
jgi:hypothetical protein